MPKPDLPTLASLEHPAEFQARHIGPDAAEQALMLKAVGAASRQALMEVRV